MLTRRAHAVDKVVSFSASMITAAPAGSLPSDGRTRVVPQGVNLPTDEEPVHSTDGDAEDANAPAPPPPPLPLHEACGVPSTTPVFLLPAGLRPVKDVLWAIDAIDSIGASSNSDPFVLAILGPSLDDEYRDTVIERLKTSKHAVLIPPVDRAHTVGYMRAAAAVVNTSKSEGQSGAILEAAAAGVPIIARDIPGNRTLLDLLFDATGTEKGGGECDFGEFKSQPDGFESHLEGFESHPCGVLCPTPESFAAALASSAAGRERRSTDRAALGAECLARGERDGWRDIIGEVIGERPEGGCDPPDVAAVRG